MEIRKITKEDAAKASRIYALSWKIAYRNIVPQNYLDSLSLDRWTPFLKDSLFDGYVLIEDGEYIATTSISPAREEEMQGWGEIISLYVLPEYFYKGYGKKLLEFAVSELKSQGFNDTFLWVLEENRQGRDFYERNNFIPNGDKTIIKIDGKELVEMRYVYNQNTKPSYK
ncbi:MAG: GNAT family N-acetyltransferase [Tissierellia bacterium]|nr:GNAT family N-acetyltransferase [Tissierellia bacterium]